MTKGPHVYLLGLSPQPHGPGLVRPWISSTKIQIPFFPPPVRSWSRSKLRVPVSSHQTSPCQQEAVPHRTANQHSFILCTSSAHQAHLPKFGSLMLQCVCQGQGCLAVQPRHGLEKCTWSCPAATPLVIGAFLPETLSNNHPLASGETLLVVVQGGLPGPCRLSIGCPTSMAPRHQLHGTGP